jgi:4'-phosphopantetheinyl transferase
MLHWLISDLDRVADGDSWLSPGERARVAQMAFAKRRNEWRLGRWVAKQAIIRHLLPASGADQLPRIDIRASADGAPEAFLDDGPLPISLSLSHSSQRGLCVLGPRDAAVGCDLELVLPKNTEFVTDYFTESEVALLSQTPTARHPEYVTLIWSAKESALKSLREGLRRDTRTVVVDFDPSAVGAGGWVPLAVRCTETGRIFEGWWQTAGGYVLTVTSTCPHTPPVWIK